MKRISIVALIILMAVLSGCKGTFLKENNEIEEALRNETDVLIAEYVENIKSEEYSKIPTNLEKTVFDGQSEEELNQVFELLNQYYAENDQELIHEYYGNSGNNGAVYMIDCEYFEDFSAQLRIKGEEYLKFFKLNNGIDELVIVYGLEKRGGWKLSSIRIGSFTYLGKTASQWLLEGDNCKAHGYELPAALCYINAYQGAAIPYLSHNKMDVIMEGVQYGQELQANGMLPIKIETEKSKLEIYTVQTHMRIENNEIGYTIGYLSEHVGDSFVTGILRRKLMLSLNSY